MIFKKKKLPEVPKKQEPEVIKTFSIYSFWLNKVVPDIVFDSKFFQKRIHWKVSPIRDLKELQVSSDMQSIYIIQNNIVWEAGNFSRTNKIVFRPSSEQNPSKIRRMFRGWWGGSYIVLDVSKRFIKDFDFRKRYPYAIDFVINYTTKAISLKIKHVKIALHQSINNIEPIIEFFEEDFRLKLFSKSKANLVRLQKLWGDQGLPDVVWIRLNEILKGFIVDEFGKDVCPDFNVVSLYTAFAMAYFPTEPRLFFLLQELRSVSNPAEVPLIESPITLESNRSDLNIFHLYFNDVPKSIKKLYLKDPFVLNLYKLLKSDFRIDDVNVIRYWIRFMIGVYNPCHKGVQINKDDTADILVKNTFDPEQGYHFVGTMYLTRILQSYRILKKEFNFSTEKALKTLLKGLKVNIGTREFWDTIYMFQNNWNRFDKDATVIKEFLKHGVCTATHDSLSREINNLGKPNIVFENITDKQRKRFESAFKVLDKIYYFKLAEDSNRLREIGDVLKICVGSAGYDERVLRGKCLIAYVETDMQKYLGCIEIRQEQIVHQARTYCNQSFSGELEQVFEVWLKHSKLQFYGNYF